MAGPHRKVKWLRAATPLQVLDAMDRHLAHHKRQPFSEEDMWQQLAQVQWAQVAWRLEKGRFELAPGPQGPQSVPAQA